MGQIKGKVNGNAGSYVNYYIEYTLNSQSVEKNTSNITLKHYAQATSTAAGAYNNNSGSGGCLSKLAYQGISGLYDYVVNRYQTVDFRNKKLVDLGSWTGDVKHLDDGSLTIDLLAEFDTNGPASVTTGSASGSWELPTIPRASSFSSSNGTIEGSATININSASSSFTHTITYNFGNASGTIASGLKGTSISYTWTIPTTFYAQIQNSKSGTCTLTVITYSGSTEVGRDSGTITIGTNESKCKPSVGGSIVDTNSATIALTGNSSKLIKYKSTAKVTGTASPKNSSSIKSILVDSGTTNPLTVYNVSKNSFAVNATDSRGYSNSTTLTATMIPYVNLTCKAEFKRVTQTGSEITLNYSGNYFNGSFGTTSNNLTLSWAYRKKGDSFWTTGGTLTPTISGNTYSGSISCGTEFDYRTNYEFIVYYADKLNNLNTGVIPVSKGQGALEVYESVIKVDGHVVCNGLAYYGNGQVDPNTTLEELILTDHENNPVRNGFWYIHTMFYSSKTVTSHRTQIAYTYNSHKGIYQRYYNSGSWSDWREVASPRKTLYDNSSGSTGTITLSRDLSEFSKVEISYTLTNMSNWVGTIEVINPNGKYANIHDQSFYFNNTSNFGVDNMYKNIYLSGTSITIRRYGILSNTGTATLTDNIAITRVVGYE